MDRRLGRRRRSDRARRRRLGRVVGVCHRPGGARRRTRHLHLRLPLRALLHGPPGGVPAAHAALLPPQPAVVRVLRQGADRRDHLPLQLRHPLGADVSGFRADCVSAALELRGGDRGHGMDQPAADRHHDADHARRLRAGPAAATHHVPAVVDHPVTQRRGRHRHPRERERRACREGLCRRGPSGVRDGPGDPTAALGQHAAAQHQGALHAGRREPAELGNGDGAAGGRSPDHRRLALRGQSGHLLPVHPAAAGAVPVHRDAVHLRPAGQGVRRAHLPGAR